MLLPRGEKDEAAAAAAGPQLNLLGGGHGRSNLLLGSWLSLAAEKHDVVLLTKHIKHMNVYKMSCKGRKGASRRLTIGTVRGGSGPGRPVGRRGRLRGKAEARPVAL